MAADDKNGLLRVEMVTPLGPVASTETDAVTAPGELGELEVFPGHVPFLTELHAGVLVLGRSSGKSRTFYAVGPGFLEVTAEGLVRVLVERAVAGGDVDLEAAKAERDETEPEVKSWKKALDADYVTLRARYDWALAQLEARERAA